MTRAAEEEKKVMLLIIGHKIHWQWPEEYYSPDLKMCKDENNLNCSSSFDTSTHLNMI
jgi:hypothetical protein